MLLDMQTLYSDAQAITNAATSENVVKLASNQFKMTEVAFGTPIPMDIRVTEDFAGITALKVAFETSATEDFAEAETLVKVTEDDADKLVAGYIFPIKYVPKGNKGYTRLNYTPTGTATSGRITAGLVMSHDNSYQDM